MQDGATSRGSSRFHAQQIVMRTGRQPAQTVLQTHTHIGLCGWSYSGWSPSGKPPIPLLENPFSKTPLFPTHLAAQAHEILTRAQVKQTNKPQWHAGNSDEGEKTLQNSTGGMGKALRTRKNLLLLPARHWHCHSCNRKLSHLFGYALVSHISLSTCGK